MKRHSLLLGSVFLLTILIVGSGCDTSPDEIFRRDSADWITAWFSGETIPEPIIDGDDTTATTNTGSVDLDTFPTININGFNTNAETGNTNTTTPPETSILEDLYPEKYGKNANTNTQTSSTSLWVHETDIEYSEDATRATWKVQVVKGSDTEDSDEGVSGVSVIAEFRNTNGTEQITSVTNDGGWALWTRPKETIDTEMFIIGIQGGFSWNALDTEFWSRTPALSVSASEWTVTKQ